MDFHSLIERKRERFQQLESAIADPRLFENRKRASETMREHAAIKDLLAKGDELQIARQQLDDNRELATSVDADLAQMAQDGYARSIFPSHMPNDGDTVFALATGQNSSSGNPDVGRIGALAAEMISDAIERAVLKAKGLPGYPAAAEIR